MIAQGLAGLETVFSATSCEPWSPVALAFPASNVCYSLQSWTTDLCWGSVISGRNSLKRRFNLILNPKAENIVYIGATWLLNNLLCQNSIMEQGHTNEYAGEEFGKILYFTKLGRRLRSEFFVSNKLRLLSLPMEEIQEPSAELVFPGSVEWLWWVHLAVCLGTRASTAIWVWKEHTSEVQLYFLLAGLLSAER